jgi:diacylglycerol kinase family enzyme
VGNRPLHPTPEAGFDTGLAVYARRRMGMAGMLFSMARISGKRPRIGARGAYVVHDLESVTVLADEPIPYQMDGDAVEFREKVTFRSVPDAIRVVVAAGQTGQNSADSQRFPLDRAPDGA